MTEICEREHATTLDTPIRGGGRRVRLLATVAVLVGCVGCGALEDPPSGESAPSSAALTATDFTGSFTVTPTDPAAGSTVTATQTASNLTSAPISPIIMGIQRVGFRVVQVIRPRTGTCRIAGNAVCNFIALAPGETQSYTLVLLPTTSGVGRSEIGGGSFTRAPAVGAGRGGRERSCNWGRRRWERGNRRSALAALAPGPLKCQEKTTCQGACGSFCSARCEEDSQCLLAAADNSELLCQSKGSCDFSLGDGGVVLCQVESTCRVRCSASCSLRCQSGATCALQCGASAAVSVAGSGVCP